MTSVQVNIYIDFPTRDCNS